MCGGRFPAVTVTQSPDEPRCRLPGTTSQKPGEWCNGNCPCQNFWCKNSFKSDVALKHAQGERPARKAFQKSRNCRPRRTNARDDRKDVYSVCRTRYCAHPREIDTTIVTETSVPDACLNIPAVSCVVTSASAGSRGQFPINDSNCWFYGVFSCSRLICSRAALWHLYLPNLDMSILSDSPILWLNLLLFSAPFLKASWAMVLS